VPNVAQPTQASTSTASSSTPSSSQAASSAGDQSQAGGSPVDKHDDDWNKTADKLKDKGFPPRQP
jgi:hypothetical protein